MAALPQFRLTVTEYGARPHSGASMVTMPRGYETMAYAGDINTEPGPVSVLVRDGLPLNERGAELLRLYREHA